MADGDGDYYRRAFVYSRVGDRGAYRCGASRTERKFRGPYGVNPGRRMRSRARERAREKSFRRIDYFSELILAPLSTVCRFRRNVRLRHGRRP